MKNRKLIEDSLDELSRPSIVTNSIAIKVRLALTQFLESNPISDTPQVSQSKEDIRSYNVGQSDYSKHDIQPWDIWLEYGLNPWDADIVKRVLRKKETDNRKMDYEKIIHICRERIRQIDAGYE